MKRKCFRGTKEAAEIAPWLYMIWFITGMWTSFYNLSGFFGIRKILMEEAFFKTSPESSRKDQPQQDDPQ